jgi:Lrp/AsnC family transcriptional regulator, leucine-responsive regulatory protein
MKRKPMLDRVPLDARDKVILEILMKDPRTPIADIAREAKAQRDTVLYRIRRLERKGVISKYHMILDPHALGLDIFMLALIKLVPTTDGVATFVQKLVAHRNVTHVSRLIGSSDYAVHIAAKDIAAFDDVLDDLKSFVPGIVASIDVSNVIDGLKTDDFSGLIEDSENAS